MIVWCQECQEEPVYLDEEFPKDRDICVECLYSDVPQRWVLGPLPIVSLTEKIRGARERRTPTPEAEAAWNLQEMKIQEIPDEVNWCSPDCFCRTNIIRSEN